jgi:2-polyprenyl-3-methyl-5-hydroxy-6-metoxy-1,4-benzoquinol methylase
MCKSKTKVNLFKNCPLGCETNLNQSGIFVEEGELYECPMCSQLLSSCSKSYYEESNKSWNSEEGTWPSEKNFRRLKKRRTSDIRNIANLLGKKLPEIRLLDVGCSNGSFVSIACELGLKAEGVDPSEKAVSDGLKRGLKMHQGFLDEIVFPNNTFNAITLHEVIEHVSSPTQLLKECARILKPGGILLVGTGNTNSWTRKIRKNKWDFFDMNLHGGHISFFSPKSIEILALQTGFKAKKVITRSVKFFEKNELSFPLFRIMKIITELLSLPAKIFGKGHQMEAYLQVNKEIQK